MVNAPVAIKLNVPETTKTRSVTVADGTTISAGTLMVFTAAATNTAVASTATSNIRFAGIAAADKLASDGSTRLTCWTGGKWDISISTACLAGDFVVISGANVVGTINNLSTAWLSAGIVGKVVENSSANDVVAVEVGVI